MKGWKHTPKVAGVTSGLEHAYQGIHNTTTKARSLARPTEDLICIIQSKKLPAGASTFLPAHQASNEISSGWPIRPSSRVSESWNAS